MPNLKVWACLIWKFEHARFESSSMPDLKNAKMQGLRNSVTISKSSVDTSEKGTILKNAMHREYGDLSSRKRCWAAAWPVTHSPVVKERHCKQSSRNNTPKRSAPLFLLSTVVKLCLSSRFQIASKTQGVQVNPFAQTLAESHAN